MQRGSGTHQACAACKHQRKKCTEKCILAPLFPADKAREFHAVHRIFGVSNVQKIMRNLITDEDRKKAADSLVWEALCRQRDPVWGPYGEYRKVHDELSLYKTQSHVLRPVVAHNGNGNGNVREKEFLYRSMSVGEMMNSWNINGNKMVTDELNLMAGVNNNENNCSSVIGSIPYGCFSSNLHGLRQERGHTSNVPNGPPSQQQHLINGFNHQQYYLPGQFSPLDAKSMESTIWEEGGS